MVKSFYSFHLGNEIRPSENTLEKRAKYLSANLIQTLKKQAKTDFDYFSQTNDYPKASRVGACKTISKTRASFGVLLFWRKSDKNIQREIKVEAVKEKDQWLIDKASSEN